MAYLNNTAEPDPPDLASAGHTEPQDAGAGIAPAPALAPASPAPPGCIFCAAFAADPAQDRANLVLWRGRQVFVILNRYPYNTGHLMVVPCRHLRDVTRLTAEECAELMGLFQRMVALVTHVYAPQGFNAGMNLGEVAGAGIADHLHLHLVPRWGGDTNFMPVVGQTKVLPESLEQTYDRLAAALRDE